MIGRADMIAKTEEVVARQGKLGAAARVYLLKTIARAGIAERVDEQRFRPLIMDVVAGKLVVLDELAPIHRTPRARPLPLRTCG